MFFVFVLNLRTKLSQKRSIIHIAVQRQRFICAAVMFPSVLVLVHCFVMKVKLDTRTRRSPRKGQESFRYQEQRAHKRSVHCWCVEPFNYKAACCSFQ